MSEQTSLKWWREADGRAWRSLFAAGAGWMLDAMDVTLYAVALSAIAEEFALTKEQSGQIAGVTLVAAAAGGVVSGFLADRLGRVRVLMLAVLCYSASTALTATAPSVGWLVSWRVLVGLGMGGEWSAGAVLVAETWPAKHRGKAIGLMQSGWAIGYMVAALLGALVLPRWGWRPLFVLGVAPAVLVGWMRRGVDEPRAWVNRASSPPVREVVQVMTRSPYLARALVAASACTALLFAYWGLFTWIPTYLSSSDAGGAGLGVVKSAAWIVPMQTGAFFGYASFGFLADRLGRKPTFIAFVLGAAVIVPLFGASAHDSTTLMILGPLVGFFGHGYFSVFGSMLAELFPTNIRGTAQGVCYNIGRGVSAAAPWMIGRVAQGRSLGFALGLMSGLYMVGAVLVLALPETRGKELE